MATICVAIYDAFVLPRTFHLFRAIARLRVPPGGPDPEASTSAAQALLKVLGPNVAFGDEPWESIEFASAHTFGLAPEELGERVLATILFSDIVDSTEHSSDSVITSGQGCSESTMRGFGRRSIAFAAARSYLPGDGFLALFDGVAKAVRAAALMDPAVADLGIRVRVGLHTSEIEIVGGQPRGVGVHAAARVATLAGPDDVLVSGTTHDLLDGSGLSLQPRSEHELKGLSGARTIFALGRELAGSAKP